MDFAFTYLKTHKAMLEEDYPYHARKRTCEYDEDAGKVNVSSYTDVSNSASQLQAALNKQPVSVAIEADQSAFQLYNHGVITSGCGSKLDHGVLAVGYGTDTESGDDYFLVKNSWGPSWGDHGYVKIGLTQCGITHAASYPTTD